MAAGAGIDEKKLPLEAFPGGDVEPRPGELRISVGRKPYAEILAHAGEDPEVELCGVLVGDVKRDRHGPWLHVLHVIRGEGARQRGAEVTITQETWTHIYKELDSKHPDLKLVGWYHTHPDFGVFLSERDQFIHDSHFVEPFHVAYVYDPVRGREGFFHRVEGKVSEAERFWIGSRPREVVKDPDPAAAEAAPALPAALASIDQGLKAIHARLLERRDDGGPWNLVLVLGIGAVVVLLLFSGGGGLLGRRGGYETEWYIDRTTGEHFPVVRDSRTGDAYLVTGLKPVPKPEPKGDMGKGAEGGPEGPGKRGGERGTREGERGAGEAAPSGGPLGSPLVLGALAVLAAGAAYMAWREFSARGRGD